jgi:2,4-dichlorophenol 6-monooxygenase
MCIRDRFTGIGGEAWVEAARSLGAELGLTIDTRLIGPRRALLDHTGDWARAREVSDAGCVLVRPDHHVAWRADSLTDNPLADLKRVLKSILGR